MAVLKSEGRGVDGRLEGGDDGASARGEARLSRTGGVVALVLGMAKAEIAERAAVGEGFVVEMRYLLGCRRTRFADF